MRAFVSGFCCVSEEGIGLFVGMDEKWREIFEKKRKNC
jgi:hypothetical protein